MNSLLRTACKAGALALASYAVCRTLVRRSRWVSLRNKVVILTGGSRGLGLVLARQLVKAGAKVGFCARTEHDVIEAEKELQALGGDVLGMVCDVRWPNEVQTLVDRVVERWQTVDVLFNVAGIMEVGPIDAMTLDDFRQAMDINCWGPLNTTLAVLPFMRKQGWGRIVNVASLGGKRAVPHMIPYDTSKFALVGLSNGLRTELAKDGILVTTACPSLMRTGSPRNATFKGRHREEYAWFSIGDSLPIVSLDADEAARQIINACQHGDGEVLISNSFSPAIWASQVAPELTAELLALANRWLPSMGGIGQQSAYGYESESELSPSWLTALGEAAARRNREMHHRN